MPIKYELETKEIEFFIKMTSNILILFVLVLFIFSIARAVRTPIYKVQARARDAGNGFLTYTGILNKSFLPKIFG